MISYTLTRTHTQCVSLQPTTQLILPQSDALRPHSSSSPPPKFPSNVRKCVDAFQALRSGMLRRTVSRSGSLALHTLSTIIEVVRSVVPTYWNASQHRIGYLCGVGVGRHTDIPYLSFEAILQLYVVAVPGVHVWDLRYHHGWETWLINKRLVLIKMKK